MNRNEYKIYPKGDLDSPVYEPKNHQPVEYKFSEDLYLHQISEYIKDTYNTNYHYSTGKIQTTEVVVDQGHGTGFCVGNVLKYAQRYGHKGDPDSWRKDLMKVIHYAIIQLHVHDGIHIKKEERVNNEN